MVSVFIDNMPPNPQDSCRHGCHIQSTQFHLLYFKPKERRWTHGKTYSTNPIIIFILLKTPNMKSSRDAQLTASISLSLSETWTSCRKDMMLLSLSSVKDPLFESCSLAALSFSRFSAVRLEPLLSCSSFSSLSTV